jgi:hypothetical protein
LKEKYHRSRNWIRKAIDQSKVRESQNTPAEKVVCVFDATHIGEEVLLTARAPHLKRNLGWAWIPSETKEAYAALRYNIESRGYIITAVILDGRRGIPRVFDDIPVQICQFHQMQVVRRKLTLRPETEAGQKLLSIGLNITKYTHDSLKKELDEWYKKYGKFVEEKTYILGTHNFRYTHRRMKSAYQSLVRNLPFLFTYEKHPELNIPNTTNSLDGYFSRVKNLLSAHRGKSKERIRKIITEILRN